MRLHRVCAVLLALATALGTNASAAGPQLLSEHRDWAVYQYQKDGRATCYLATFPLNRRGAAAQWRPSWILVDVDSTATPGYTVSFALDRSLDEASKVRLIVGKRQFGLISAGDTAWAADGRADLRIVVAMKRGRRMLVSASAAGATVLDTFSLMGFTSALDGATECNTG